MCLCAVNVKPLSITALETVFSILHFTNNLLSHLSTSNLQQATNYKGKSVDLVGMKLAFLWLVEFDVQDLVTV